MVDVEYSFANGDIVLKQHRQNRHQHSYGKYTVKLSLQQLQRRLFYIQTNIIIITRRARVVQKAVPVPQF